MDDAEPVMISALEHYSYCPRQCALIHVERVWSDNLYTMRGHDLHQNVHSESSHEVAGARLERSLPIWSRRLNLVGRADLVEFNGQIPCPIEYKSGRKRKGHHEELQLCAQALCLEEMFDRSVLKGAIYWHGSRERSEVVFTDALRARVEEIAGSVRKMMDLLQLPAPVNDKRCADCSLKESCLPQLVGEKGRSIKAARELFVV